MVRVTISVILILNRLSEDSKNRINIKLHRE
nr:MAG TPA: hypothetical protein [Crassvirales sp.]